MASDTPALRRRSIMIAAIGCAMLLKLYLATVTLGTNDVVAFYQFAKAIREHGLSWLYTHSILFNHPPLVGYFLGAALALDQSAFPLLLRLPGIVADVVVAAAVFSMHRHGLRPPFWAVLLLVLSPVSIMVSGFHGNTDSVMTMFLFVSAVMMLKGAPVMSGLLLALACQIKIVPLLFLPVFLLQWHAQQRLWRFALAFLSASLILCAEPLLTAPDAFVRNVLSYGGFWGTWGFTSLLRLSGLPQFSKVNYFGLSAAQIWIAMTLKLIVVVGCALLAWRRRNLGARAAFDTISYGWLILFVFSPAIAPQYLVWCMPFLLLLPAKEFVAIVVSSSLFLFAFYTVTSRGFPWYFSNATPALNRFTTMIALLPWLTFVALLSIEWSRVAERRFLVNFRYRCRRLLHSRADRATLVVTSDDH